MSEIVTEKSEIENSKKSKDSQNKNEISNEPLSNQELEADSKVNEP